MNKIELLLRDRDGDVYRAAIAADLASMAVEDEHYLRYLKTRDRLERLGYTTRFAPPLRPRPSERLTARHIGLHDDVEALVAAAKPERPLDRHWREWQAGLL